MIRDELWGLWTALLWTIDERTMIVNIHLYCNVIGGGLSIYSRDPMARIRPRGIARRVISYPMIESTNDRSSVYLVTI